MVCFFDTNILVYLFDTSDQARQQKAITCFQAALDQHTIALSTQVLQEFYAVTTRKLKPALPLEVASEQVKQFCAFDVVDSTGQSVCAALDLAVQYQLSWWDALVLEAAIRSKAQVLYSEDFSHGQRFGPLTIVNPFMPEAPTAPGLTPSA